MLITDLPEETLDQVAAALDSSTDLKNLAAVCTQFRAIVEPYHTQFRVVRAPLLSPVWKKLAENSLLSQNVRSLEVQSVEPYYSTTVDEPVIPAIFSDMVMLPNLEINSQDEDDVGALKAYRAAQNARDLDAERILVSALREMSGLTSFKWARTPPLIDPNHEDDIWMTMSKYCPSLNQIDVVDREKPYEPVLEETDDPAYRRPTHNPHDLVSFSLKTEAFNVGSFGFPRLEQGAEMLIKRCPNLEVLKLQYVLYANPHAKTVAAAPLLSGLPWTSLREIFLFGFEFISAQLASFLDSSPSLEVVSLTYIRIDEPVILSPHVLPKLRRLTADRDSMVLHSILDSAAQKPRPLEHIIGSTLDDMFLDLLEKSGSGPTLKKLSTFSMGDIEHLITRLSRIAPKLEWLNISAAEKFPITRNWFHIFGQFPHLQELHGLKLLTSDCEPPSQNTEVVRALVSICPNLTRLDWYMGNFVDRNLVAIIKRHGLQVTWSLHKTLRGREGSIYDSWGERGAGIFLL